MVMLIIILMETTHDGGNGTTKVRMLGEKETYKFLGIIEADNIKQVEMKEKNEKEHLRKTRKQLVTKLYSMNLIKRNKYLGCFPCKILGTIFEVDEGRTLTNGRKNKKTNDDA